ncbi:MAG: hypothetical protein AAF438_11455 [Pseudomonadota bacterium]
MKRFALTHDGIQREYYLFDPGDAKTTQRPLLIFLHGYGGTATGTESETTNGLNRYATSHGFAVIYPQGTWFRETISGTTNIVTSWNDLGGNRDEGPKGPLCSDDAPKYPCPAECGDCGRCGWTSCHDDLGFLQRLIDIAIDKHNADTSRIYVSGFSNGSMMAHRLACHASDKIAAAALVGGRLEKGMQCVPGNPTPLLQINGGKDLAVPYEGELPNSDFYYESATSVDFEWARANQCQEAEESWSIPVHAPSTLQCTARCAGEDKETINCLWSDGTHVWPGYPDNHGSGGYCVTSIQGPYMPGQPACVEADPDVDVWGSRLLFKFLQKHSL